MPQGNAADHAGAAGRGTPTLADGGRFRRAARPWPARRPRPAPQRLTSQNPAMQAASPSATDSPT